MFRKITQELHGIRLMIADMVKAIRIISEASQEGPAYGDMPERLSTLEGRLAVALGDIDAGILKADSLKAAARASEERERGHMKRAEAAVELAKELEGGEETDPFEAAGRWYSEHGPGNDEGSTANGVPSVPEGMEISRSGRDMAKAAKRR
jgi:hypothetical protein